MRVFGLRLATVLPMASLMFAVSDGFAVPRDVIGVGKLPTTRTLHPPPAVVYLSKEPSSEEGDAGEEAGEEPKSETNETENKKKDTFPALMNQKTPPILVEDSSLLFYDLVLLLSIAVASHWVVNDGSTFDELASVLNEGSLLCILWIVAGLSNGAFLYSAVNGNYRSGDERGGAGAAGMIGLNSSISTGVFRVLLAIIVKKTGLGEPEKDLIVLEIASGIVLMSFWRYLHSTITPRI